MRQSIWCAGGHGGVRKMRGSRWIEDIQRICKGILLGGGCLLCFRLRRRPVGKRGGPKVPSFTGRMAT